MGKFSFLPWIVGLYKRLPEVKTFAADLSGKTVIVTGANSGLGFECAKHLARMNPGKLIIACRDLTKAEEAKAEIVKETNCSTIECWKLDLGTFAGVKEFVADFEKDGGGKLDLLIQNAGINSHRPYSTTPDNWEIQVQVNHLSPSLLAFLLLPYIMKAAPSPPTPRIVLVASEMHFWVVVEKEPEGSLLEALSKDKEFEDTIATTQSWYPKAEARYPMSKMMNVMFARSFGTRLPSTTPLTINSVNPSACQSALQRDMDDKLASRLGQRMFFRTAEVGSRTILHAALSMDAQGKQGNYWNNCKSEEVADWLLSEMGQRVEKRIWDETVEVLSKVDARVPEIIREYLS